MNRMLRAVLTAGLAIAMVASPTVASADDDRKTRTGHCAGGPATYRMTLADLDDDRLRVRFYVNASQPNREWNVLIYRNGNFVRRATPTTNSNGNFGVVRTLRGDDDDVVRVRAGNGAGQICARAIELDD